MALPHTVTRFRPRLLDHLPQYSRQKFLADLSAGLTVGFVALPLAMTFAIASGLPPQAGLFTAIIAGFLISALGGSSVQIGGPAGAFIVVVYAIVERYGIPNLLIATACAGGRPPVEIVPGGGVRASNAASFLKVSPHLHASCRRGGVISRDEVTALRQVLGPAAIA